jgi:hypothetical protein
LTTGLFMAAAWADVTIGGNSYVMGSGAVCSSSGAGPTWSCQVPNGNGGIALVSGCRATPSTAARTRQRCRPW